MSCFYRIGKWKYKTRLALTLFLFIESSFAYVGGLLALGNSYIVYNKKVIFRCPSRTMGVWS